MSPQVITHRSKPGPRQRLRPRHLKSILASGEPRTRRSPRVLLAGKLSALESPGGGEVQMASLAGALPHVGVAAKLWRPWEQRLGDADCLHLFGSEPEHLTLIAAARRTNVPVVLSTVAWFDLASCWREPWPLARRLAACGKYLARAALPMLPSWRRRLYQSCDLLLPNSHAEAQQLVQLFGVQAKKIHIAPNGADPRFATEADPEPFARLVRMNRFVLYPGRIEPRKNQLGFLRAMSGTDTPIVVLGDAVRGHEAYLAECQRVAGPRVRFMSRLDHHDPLLASAYAAAGCVVLASWYETPGLVALEAGMSGVPLVLPRDGCAREYFGDLASYVSADNEAEIRTAVLDAVARPRSPELAQFVNERYSWQTAAQVTREAYEKVL